MELKQELGFNFTDVQKLGITATKGVTQNLEELMSRAVQVLEEVARKFHDLILAVLALWAQLREKNSLEMWKDYKRWAGVQWVTAVVLSLASLALLRSGILLARRRSDFRAAESWLETSVPEVTQENVQKFKKQCWRERLPRGVSLSRYVLAKDGTFRKDEAFVGERLWKEETKAIQVTSGAGVDSPGEGKPSLVESEKESLHGSENSWKQRLTKWQEVVYGEAVKEHLESGLAVYVPHFDWPEFIAGYTAEVARKKLAEETNALSDPGLRVAKQWWKYRPTMPYVWLLSNVSRGEIVSAAYSQDLRSMFVRTARGFPNEYKVDIPVDPNLHQKLLANGVRLGVVPWNPIPPFVRAALILTPGLLVIWGIFTFLYKTHLTLDELIEDKRNEQDVAYITPEMAERRNFTTFDDVVMGPQAMEVLNSMLEYLYDHRRYMSKGIKIPRGLLISGPPGTGKTLLARAIARESGLPMVYASGGEFADSEGGGSAHMNDIFMQARSMAPSFIFIDEVDAIAAKSVMNDRDRRAVFNQLLSELDGDLEDTNVNRFAYRQAVVLIAATNRRDELDDDFLKSGRIDREIHVGLPTSDARIQIFDIHARGKNFSPDVDFSQVVFRTVGFSGADIRNLVNEASIVAVRKNLDMVTQQEVVDALDKLMYEGLGISMTAEEEREAFFRIPDDIKRLVAIHEAGHVLLAHLFPRFDWHAFSQVGAGGNEDGISLFYPRQEFLDYMASTEGYIRMQMVVSYGGRCAERIVYGDDRLTDACFDDLQEISKLARELTVSYANPKFGLVPLFFEEQVAWSPHSSPLIPNKWGGYGVENAKMTIPFSEMFTREITRYMAEAESVAMEGIRNNRHILEAIADYLCENSKLNGRDAHILVKSMNPTMLPDYFEGVFNTEKEPLPSVPKPVEKVKLDPYKPGRYESLDVYPAPLHRC